jgi:TolB protein
MRKLYLLLAMLILPTMILRAQDATPPGRIAYIGTDYNVYVEDFEHDTTIALTDDADAENLYFYEMPTWATDGRLAYFSRERVGTDLNMGVYVTRDSDEAGTLVYEATNHVLNYAYWSPEDCFDGEHCRDLAMLVGVGDTLTVEMVRDNDDGASNQTIGEGAPFYYSWSPDGTQMLWQRNQETLEVYNVENDDVTSTLDDVPGLFQAPMWSPVDDRLLYGALNGETTDLTVLEDGESRVLASELNGIVAFAWSPDGRYIAYTEGYRSLIVLDASNGDVLTETLEDGVYAFFWSPNSESLAYITLASTQNSIGAKAQQPSGISWSVMTVPDGEQRHFGAFLPTNDMLYVFTYFDQFAQSHRVWSPDSRYLVYSEFTSTGDSQIQVLDTNDTNAAPETIGEGIIGIWSFE